jgi:RHS repeat-associated protein
LYSKGRLTEVHSSVTRNIVDEYDAEGRVKRSRQRTDGKGYRMAYTYDLAGNLTTETYPSGRLVTIAYNRAGRPRNVQDLDKTYVSGVLYSPHGAVTQMTRGNGLFEEATYNLRLQPKTIGLGTSLGNPDKLRIEYGYGNDRAADSATNNGNLTAQTIRVGASTWPQTYNYDGVNRLQSATEGGYWSQGYSYDRWGNRAVISGLVLTPALTPQTLGAFNTANNRLATWVYDQAGNLTQDGLGRTFDYDAENRQTRAVADTYFYDGEGRRVKKVVGGATTTFVYDAFGKLVAEYSGARQFWVSHITSDHLGSTRAVTNDTGVVQSRLDYLPFGEEIPSTVGGRGGVAGYGTDAGIRQKFTGKERDLETGLDYFGARYLSSAQGRFTGPDEPVVFADPDDPQTWNLYTYARNNPHRFVDPDGNDWFTANGEVPLWIDCERNPSGCNAQQAAGWSRWMPTESGHTLLIDYLNGTFRLGVDASGNPTSSYTGPIGMVDTTFSLIPNPQGGVSSLFLAGTVKQSGGMMLRSAAQGQVHHIATNKSVKSGFTKQFARIFKKAGMTLQDAANKVFLLGHKGRHAIRYHQHVLERLSKAVSGKSGAEARNALVKELQLIRQELLRNPDMIRGDFK